jgi:hypothetical protein
VATVGACNTADRRAVERAGPTGLGFLYLIQRASNKFHNLRQSVKTRLPSISNKHRKLKREADAYKIASRLLKRRASQYKLNLIDSTESRHRELSEFTKVTEHEMSLCIKRIFFLLAHLSKHWRAKMQVSSFRFLPSRSGITTSTTEGCSGT